MIPSTPEEHAAAEFRKQRLSQINERRLSFFAPQDLAAELRPGPHLLRAVVRG
ncbi:hypothetical protein [Nocardia colli]|uniref:hypothetical protein n=1 Tax=Nocardia colli TaxID=2545717 RepID=UPI00168CF6A6|nr:hypothetical protein [Nocardia colli]